MPIIEYYEPMTGLQLNKQVTTQEMISLLDDSFKTWVNKVKSMFMILFEKHKVNKQQLKKGVYKINSTTFKTKRAEEILNIDSVLSKMNKKSYLVSKVVNS